MFPAVLIHDKGAFGLEMPTRTVDCTIRPGH